jgi:hypothetical protein
MVGIYEAVLGLLALESGRHARAAREPFRLAPALIGHGGIDHEDQ